MYYFDILDILQRNPGRKYTSTEIFIILSKSKPTNKKNIDRILLKLAISHKQINRELVMLPKSGEFTKNPMYPAYVYFFDLNTI